MNHYDTLEIRDPAERESALFAELPKQIAHAQTRSAAYGQLLEGIDPLSVCGRAALARLPVTRKSALAEKQAARPPFGGFAAIAPGSAARIFASPGPIYEPEARRPDYWRFARAFFAAGFRPGEVVHNCFSYHFTPGGFMAETGALALGCAVVPAGVGQTEQQVRAIADIRPDGYVGTPSFLKIILEKGEETGANLSSLKKALVSGEACPAPMRAYFNDRGIDVYQCYASADLGLIAYETSAREGLVMDESLILEIVRPGTGDPVADGEVGEVVVTSLNPDYPLIRFATGDLSAVLPGTSPCGRTNVRIKGWMGRADQTAKVRGMFVHPSQVADVVKRFPQVGRARLILDLENAYDRMTLQCEATGSESLAAEIAGVLRDLTKLRGEVAFVAPGSLPNDGKVIDDLRKYD